MSGLMNRKRNNFKLKMFLYLGTYKILTKRKKVAMVRWRKRKASKVKILRAIL